MIVDLKVLTNLAKDECLECFVWDQRAASLVFYAKPALAGFNISLRVDYTDERGGKSQFPFFIEVDPLPEVSEEPDDSDSEDGASDD